MSNNGHDSHAVAEKGQQSSFSWAEFLAEESVKSKGWGRKPKPTTASLFVGGSCDYRASHISKMVLSTVNLAQICTKQTGEAPGKTGWHHGPQHHPRSIMPILSPVIAALRQPCAPLFPARTWSQAPRRRAGTLRASGRRTVSTAL